jgi:hypothetical protein
MIKPPKRLTVLVDSREKDPIFFPRIIPFYPERHSSRILIHLLTEEVALDAGDYCLKGYESLCGIERKKNLGEIATNLLSRDRRRAIAALDRFAKQYVYRYLLVEATVAQFYTDISHQWGNAKGDDQAPLEVRDPPCPELIQDTLFRELTIRHIRPLIVGRGASVHTRTRMGEILVRLMLSHVLHYLGPSENIETIP